MGEESELQYTRHFKAMLKERSISMSLINRTLTDPEKIEDRPDGTRHFLRQIPRHGNRWLRVIVNTNAVPNKAITAFFDRRLRGKR
jgi:capsule polysaccharide modification protein KpsS